MSKSSISEKVKFWQEQDKINNLMIPRVLRLYKTMEEISSEIKEIPEKIALAESRAQEKAIKTVDTFKEDISNKVSEFKSQFLGWENDLYKIKNSVEAKLLEEEKKLFFERENIRKLKTQTYWVTGASILISVTAIIITIIK
ncbi:MAG: hypothetical protein BroJett005_21930 [Ignavibacteriota bacterium]|nr:MAG: hypothetical protein BroJett005_21930 [Ignavibacteriota bacterium]